MIKAKYFVITLFNIKIYANDKNKVSVDTKEWIDERFDIFDSFCFASMKNQTTNNFIWLCLFDADTPAIYKQRICEYQKILPLFRPVYINRKDVLTWKDQLKKVISTYITNDDEYIVTTNLDNDDSLHCKMLEEIQTIVPQNGPGLYTFRTGLQYFIDKGLLLKMTYPHNHFLTICEKNDDNFKIVVEYRHASARKQIVKKIDIKNKLYWIENVHKRNVNNDLRFTTRIKYIPVLGKFSLQDYGLSIKFSTLHNIVNAFFVFPIFFLSMIPKKIVYKIKKLLFKED